jgi:phenol 2-monooxygenase
VYAPDFKNGKDIFDMRNINRDKGCIMIVRPDQYVAHVLPLNAYNKVEKLFLGFLLEKNLN